jgi:hypothetical protein
MSAIEAARAALEGAQPSAAMAERAARLLLTEAGELPVVHVAIGKPQRPLCGNPDGPGPGGYTSLTLAITCQGCMDAHGFTEDQLAEFDRWIQEGSIPEDRRAAQPLAEFLAEARALRG